MTDANHRTLPSLSFKKNEEKLMHIKDYKSVPSKNKSPSKGILLLYSHTCGNLGAVLPPNSESSGQADYE